MTCLATRGGAGEGADFPLPCLVIVIPMFFLSLEEGKMPESQGESCLLKAWLVFLTAK